MPDRVEISLTDTFSRWHRSEAEREDGVGQIDVWTQGQAWLGATYLHRQALAEWWASWIPSEFDSLEAAFQNALEALNGNFAVVLQAKDTVLAAVDRVRSSPLFYGQKEHRYIISDDARRVRDFVGPEPHVVACYEFLLLGYVTGGDTLISSVMQLKPGEMLRIAAVGDGPRLKTHRYYRYVHEECYSAPAEELFPILDGVLVGSIERLVQSSQGQTLVIPLSGGLDSRLICVMLKRLGVQDLICFSYGRVGNQESHISQGVAKKLGYPWYFVPYSGKAWSRWFRSEERQTFYRYCDGLSSLPITQEWPAIWELKKKGLLPDEALFVPGHTGDFVTGKHIPRGLQSNGHIGLERLVSEILAKHYVLWDWKNHQDTLRPKLAERVRIQLDGLQTETSGQAASAYEAWEWQERQAKFIVNSVHAYDFWGYGWRLPFWDAEVMHFWSRVPLALRYRQTLYASYLAEMHGDFFEEKSAARPGPASSLKQAADRLGIKPAALRIRQLVRHYTMDYFQHPMAWYGIHSWGHHMTFRTDAGLSEGLVFSKPQNINSYLAMDYLNSGFSDS